MQTGHAGGRVLSLVVSFVLVSFTLMMAFVPAGDSVRENPLPLSVAAGPPVPYDYSNYTDVELTLTAFQASYPHILSVNDIGDSWETTAGSGNRDILAVKISDNVAVDEDEPELLIMALHHAREWPTTEIAMQFVQSMIVGYGTDARISWLVDNREIWVIPVVNPDGLDYAMSVDDMWRKNRRDIESSPEFGVDLNRNYNGSENGDPAGDWGGVGSSDDPASEVYCGAAPFSEPELQAVRDFVDSHDFQIGIDFHSYGELVLWPWCYNSNITADNEDLIRIGNELAAVNGYTATQGIDLYPTTGDSTDWLYGHSNIFAYCIEVGSNTDGFHPPYKHDVDRILSQNVPVAILASELCGDKYGRAFDMVHSPPGSLNYSISGWELSVNITAARGVDTSALSLFIRVDSSPWSQVPLQVTASNDTYAGLVSPLPAGSTIDYYFVAKDLGGVERMLPSYSPYEVFTATVLAPASDPPVADAGGDAVVAMGVSCALDGSGSYDDVAIESYVWTFEDNGPQTLYGVAPEYTFVSPGVFNITLNVTDGEGQSSIDNVIITVYDGVAPVALAGADGMILTGGSFELNGSESTDNVAIVSWRWTFVYNGSDVVLVGEVMEFIFWTEGVYLITLNVTDAHGNWDAAEVTVTVLLQPIPEFSTILVPVLAVLLALMLCGRFKRRTSRSVK